MQKLESSILLDTPLQDWSPFDFLPEDVALYTFSFLNETHLVLTNLVSKKWYILSSKDFLWRFLFKRSFPNDQLEDQLTYKEAFIRKTNWSKGLFKESIYNLKQKEIRNYYKSHHLFILDVNSPENKAQSQLEVRCQNNKKKLHFFTKMKQSQYLRGNHENFIYSYKESIKNITKNPKWTIHIKVFNAQQKLPSHRYVHLGFKPSLTFLDIYKNKIVAKVNHIFLYISDFLKKNVMFIPLVSSCDPRYHNLICRIKSKLWVGDAEKIKIYDILTGQLNKEIELFNLDGFHVDQVLFSKKILLLTPKAIEYYKIEKNKIKKIWEKHIENGLNKKIISPQDQSSHFGLYQKTSKTLEIFDLIKGEFLFIFTNFKARKIRLNTHSIEYLNEHHQLVTRFFSPKLALINKV